MGTSVSIEAELIGPYSIYILEYIVSNNEWFQRFMYVLATGIKLMYRSYFTTIKIKRDLWSNELASVCTQQTLHSSEFYCLQNGRF